MTASARPGFRVLIVGLNYAPEPIGIAPYTTGLAESLAHTGHQVDVVVGQPYYPQWKVYPGFARYGWTRAVRNGVAITRCPHFVPEVPGGRYRALHHLSFAAAALPVIIARCLRERPDVVLCITPSLISAITARIGAWLARAPLWLHVQDFEIDAAFATGLVSGGHFERALRWLEKSLFKSAATVSTISPKMVERLLAKGVAADRALELRNWANISAAGTGAGYRREWGLEGLTVVLYSGSIGRKQGAELILEAARRLAGRRDLVFVVCGEGPNLADLKRAAQDLPMVRFQPLQPADRLADLLATADMHLLPQIVAASDLVLPSKLTNILASGRPVVVTAPPGSGLAGEIEGCGIAVPPGDADALACAITTLADSPELAAEMGAMGKLRAIQRWSREAILAAFEQRLGWLAQDFSAKVAAPIALSRQAVP